MVGSPSEPRLIVAILFLPNFLRIQMGFGFYG